MKKKIKFLLTNLSCINHNYGAQGIAFPFMERLSEHFSSEYTFVLPEEYYEGNLSLSKEYGLDIITSPKPLVVLGKCYFLVYILYNFARLLRGKRIITEREKEQYSALVERLRASDVVVDLSGIELNGNLSFKRKYLNYIEAICMQRLAERYNKPYFKYTKSYGPFRGMMYRFLVRKSLNGLPFVFIRGKGNLRAMQKLNLRVPIYSFPDISIVLGSDSRNWAVRYTTNLGLEHSKPIIGVSPSSVIARIKVDNDNSSCGLNHIRLCKEIIEFYQSEALQVLLLPHSVGDGKDIGSCDLALSKKVCDELRNRTNVFMVSDMGLTYKQVRAIIGLLDFYITGRYHSISSALSMGIPIVSLSWHVKYRDVMSLFLDDFLTIDCRSVGVKKGLELIKRYYYHREWFDKEEVLRKKGGIIKQIDKSIEILVGEINKYLE